MTGRPSSAFCPIYARARYCRPPSLAALEQRAWGQNLSLATTRGEDAQSARQALERAWQQLTAAQRQEPQLVLAYAEQLRQVGAQSEAEQVLRTALKRDYESHLARLYGLVRGDDPARQLQTAEGWLKAHPQDASLLLTLGRLSLQNRLWGKARDYLESSLRMERNPEACAEPGPPACWPGRDRTQQPAVPGGPRPAGRAPAGPAVARRRTRLTHPKARAKARALGAGNLSTPARWRCNPFLQSPPTTTLEISYTIQRLVVAVAP